MDYDTLSTECQYVNNINYMLQTCFNTLQYTMTEHPVTGRLLGDIKITVILNNSIIQLITQLHNVYFEYAYFRILYIVPQKIKKYMKNETNLLYKCN